MQKQFEKARFILVFGSLSIIFLILSLNSVNAVSTQNSCVNITYYTTTTLAQNENNGNCWISIPDGTVLTLNNYNITAKGIINNGTIVFESKGYDISGTWSYYNPATSVLNITTLINNPSGVIYLQEPMLNISNVYNYGIINETLLSTGPISCIYSPASYTSSYAGSGGSGGVGNSGFVSSGGPSKIGLIVYSNIFYNKGIVYDRGLNAISTAYTCVNTFSNGGNTLIAGGSDGGNGETPPQKLLVFTENFSLLDSAGGGWGLSGAGGSGGAVVEILHRSQTFDLGTINVSGGKGIGNGGNGGTGQVFTFYTPFPSLTFTSTLLYDCPSNHIINQSIKPSVRLMLPSTYSNITAITYTNSDSFIASIKKYNQSYAVFNFTVAPKYYPTHKIIVASYSNNTFYPITDSNLIWTLNENQSENLSFNIELNNNEYTKYSKIDFNQKNYTYTPNKNIILVPSFSGQPYSYKIWFYWNGRYIGTKNILAQSPYFNPCDPVFSYNYTKYISYNGTIADIINTVVVTNSTYNTSEYLEGYLSNISSRIHSLATELNSIKNAVSQESYYGNFASAIENLTKKYTLIYKLINDSSYLINLTDRLQTKEFAGFLPYVNILNSTGYPILSVQGTENKTYNISSPSSLTFTDGNGFVNFVFNPKQNYTNNKNQNGFAAVFNYITYPFSVAVHFISSLLT